MKLGCEGIGDLPTGPSILAYDGVLVVADAVGRVVMS
jgi:hypothetical protein